MHRQHLEPMRWLDGKTRDQGKNKRRYVKSSYRRRVASIRAMTFFFSRQQCFSLKGKKRRNLFSVLRLPISLPFASILASGCYPTDTISSLPRQFSFASLGKQISVSTRWDERTSVFSSSSVSLNVLFCLSFSLCTSSRKLADLFALVSLRMARKLRLFESSWEFWHKRSLHWLH